MNTYILEERPQLWAYISEGQKELAQDGMLLVSDRSAHPNQSLSDYSYLVFPYAKLYEGFLKQLFRDLGIIGDREYKSEHFRVGKVLSPNLVRMLRGKSAYSAISEQFGRGLADELWTIWKQGRNMVFHYFPHNLRRISYAEAMEIIIGIVVVMDHAVTVTGVSRGNR